MHIHEDNGEHGDHGAEPPTGGPVTTMSEAEVAAIRRAFAHPHEVVHLVHTAIDEADANQRIAALLNVEGTAVGTILDQPLRQMLPEYRARLSVPSQRI